MTLRDRSERKPWLPSDNFGMQFVALTFGWVCGYRRGWIRGFGAAVEDFTRVRARAMRSHWREDYR